MDSDSSSRSGGVGVINNLLGKWNFLTRDESRHCGGFIGDIALDLVFSTLFTILISVVSRD